MTDEECRAVAYALKVLCRVDLEGEWKGWRLRGRELKAPNGVSVSERKLKAMLMLEEWKRPKVQRTKEPKQGKLKLKN